MDTSEFGGQRVELVEAIRHDEEELREAVQELAGAARSTFTLSERVRAAPLEWLVGGLLLGLWLGGRPARNER